MLRADAVRRRGGGTSPRRRRSGRRSAARRRPRRASRKKYSASTRPAIVDALLGKERSTGPHISACLRPGCRIEGSRSSRARVALAAHHDDDERAEREDGRGAGDAHRAHDRPGRSGRSSGRSDSSRAAASRPAMPTLPAEASTMAEPQIARAVLDAEQIPRQPAVRRQHDDAGRVRELLACPRPRRSGSRRPCVSASIDGWSPVRKCQPSAAPGRL